MKTKRFPLTITLAFDVSYFENRSGLSDQELANYVVQEVYEERRELVMEAKIVLLETLAGNFDSKRPAGSPGLALEPGVADLALGLGTGQTEHTATKKVGWFARVAGFIPRKRRES